MLIININKNSSERKIKNYSLIKCTKFKNSTMIVIQPVFFVRNEKSET